MSFIEFTPKESVKIKILDEQHEDYIHVVNQIYDNILPGDKTAIINLLNKLIELLEIHFDTEEKLMKEYHDPGYISHKLEHDRYYNQIIDMTDKYRKGEVNWVWNSWRVLKNGSITTWILTIESAASFYFPKVSNKFFFNEFYKSSL